MKNKLNNLLLDFVAFAKVVMGIDLEDFQALLFRLIQKNIEGNRNKKETEKTYLKLHFVKSRQCGGSFSVALISLILCIFFPNVQVVFCSYIQSEASLKIALILSLYDKLPNFIRNKVKLVERNKRNVTFSNGSKVNSFGAVSVRGISSSSPFVLCLLDEFNFFPKHISDEVFNSITPLFTRAKNGALILMSTPFRKDDKYFDILKNNKSFTKISISWFDMSLLCNNVKEARKVARLGQMSTVEMVEKYGTKRLQDIFEGFGVDNLEQFEQEYCCKFPDYENSYIKLEEIERCINLEKDYKSIQELKKYNNLFLGYDVGKKDLSVITVMTYREDDGVYELLYKKEMKDVNYVEQEEFIGLLLEELGERFNFGYIDGTGVGDSLYDFIKKRWGEDKIQKIHFTLKSKTEMVNIIKVGLQKKQIELVADNRMVTDILKIKRIPTKTGVTFDADRDANGHADNFWSLALCCLAIKDSIGEDLADFEFLNINLY